MAFNVLFVCTGNVFRSLSAELLLTNYLMNHKYPQVSVRSAGTTAIPQQIHPSVLSQLASFGIDASNHHQHKLDEELIKWADLIIAMHTNHLPRIEELGGTAILFEEAAFGEHVVVPDVEDMVPRDRWSNDTISQHVNQIVPHIAHHIPALVKYIQRFTLFDEFAQGRSTHLNGAPFTILKESQHSFAFLSLDIPQVLPGHVLVAPKRRESHVHNLPKYMIGDLFSLAADIGERISRGGEDYNLLLNDGFVAGQYIFHAHVHVIPRRSGDGVEFENWAHHHCTAKEMDALNKEWKKRLN